jgi:hypothetical protein
LMEDMETGESMEVSPTFMRSRYRNKIQEHIETLHSSASGTGTDHVLVNTTDPLDIALRNYLLFRQGRR